MTAKHLVLGLSLVLGHLVGPVSAWAYGSPTFPCPPEIAPRVAFWVRVFTEFSEDQRIVHDARYPWIIYEVLDVDSIKQREIDRLVTARKKHYTDLLDRLVRESPAQYDGEERRVADLLASVPEPARFAFAREYVRSQPGVKEQFQKGVRRSGRFMDLIQGVLDSLNVPCEIAYLPHVESSFHPSVRSKAGAVGLWQFTTRTGKNFLRIRRDLDERLDPMVSSRAAARYLQHAQAVLGSWPLAVISYNHGIGGMARAVAQVGSTDLVRVLEDYDGPHFGFASQNFYCEFLAAMEVARNAEKYLGPLPIDLPLVLDHFRLPDPIRAQALQKAFGLTTLELKDLNPALGPSYLQGSRPIPEGYLLHLPLGRAGNPALRYAAIPAAERSQSTPVPDGYKVRPGDTLGEIARRHRTSVDALRQLNSLRLGDRIFPGQTLVLPDASPPRL